MLSLLYLLLLAVLGVVSTDGENTDTESDGSMEAEAQQQRRDVLKLQSRTVKASGINL